MNQEQMFAIKCAYADLQGSLEAHEADAYETTHDWESHAASIAGLEQTFPELTQKSYTVEVCFGFKKRYQIVAPNLAEAFTRAASLCRNQFTEADKLRKVDITNIYEINHD
jgi:septation ring formation regulator EzrA